MTGLGTGSASAVEVLLTFIFVSVVPCATSRIGAPTLAGLAIDFALTCGHLPETPLTRTSVNPAHAPGPALILRSSALSQVWVLTLTPFLTAVLAALLHRYLLPLHASVTDADELPAIVNDRQTGRTSTTP